MLSKDHKIEFLNPRFDGFEQWSNIGDKLEAGETVQTLIGYSDEQMQQFYDYALELYRMERYQDACDVLFVIIVLNSAFYSAWISYGMTLQKLQSYEQAVLAFEMAISIGGQNAAPYLMAAQCSTKAGDLCSAREYLEELFEKVEQNAANAQEFERAAALLKHIEGADK